MSLFALPDPFANPNAALPTFVAPRPGVDDSLRHILERLSSGSFAVGAHMIGTRGVGKSVALRLLAASAEADGIFAPRLTLHHTDLLPQLSKSLDAAHRAFLDRPAVKARRKSITAAVQVKVPYTPATVTLERRQTDDDNSRARDALHKTIVQLAGAGQPVLLLLDEAECLSGALYEEFFVEVLGWASENDAPISLVTAGAGTAHVRAFRTENRARSYGPELTNILRMNRLSADDSRDLLVQTAAAGGQRWEDLDLGPLIDVTQGIPRALHAGGRRLYRAQVPTNESVLAVAEEVRVSRYELLHTMIRREDTQLFEALKHALPSRGSSAPELEVITDVCAADASLTVGGVLDYIDRLESVGIVERDAGGGVALLYA